MTRPTKERLSGIRRAYAITGVAGTPDVASLLAELDALTAERDAAIKSSWDVGTQWEEEVQSHRDDVAKLTAERDQARAIVAENSLAWGRALKERDEARNAVKRLRFACWESEAEFDDALGETDVLIASWDAEEGGSR